MSNYLSEIVVGNTMITLSPDEYVTDYFEYDPCEGLFFQSTTSNRIDSGDKSIFQEYDNWQEDLENINDNFREQLGDFVNGLSVDEWVGNSLDKLTVNIGSEEWLEEVDGIGTAATELSDHHAAKPDIMVIENRYHTVYVDVPAFIAYTGVDRDKVMDGVEATYHNYLEWCDGNIFVMSAHTWDDEDEMFHVVDSLGGCMFNSWMDDNEVLSLAKDYFADEFK